MQRIKGQTQPSISSHSTRPFIQHHPSIIQPKNFLQLPLNHTSPTKETSTSLNTIFKVDRKSLTFYGQENNEQIITVQNIGKLQLKLNITVPKTKYFGIKEQHRSFILASGMQKKITVSMIKIPPDQSCLDFIYFQTETKFQLSEKIELNWYSLRSTLEYQNLVDLQKIQTGRINNFSVEFKNNSKNLTKRINLNKDPMDNIQIHPETFKLKPNQSVTVELGIIPQIQGVYHHKIIVLEEGNLQKPLEIVYTAINCAYRIEDQQGNTTRELDFGNLIKGTKKQETLWAHNSGPHEVEVKIKIKIGRSLRAESSLQSPQQFGVQCSSTVIEPLIKVMRVAPFSKAKIPLIAYLSAQTKDHQLVQRLARSETLSNSLLSRLQKEESYHQQVLVCQFLEISKLNIPQLSSKASTSVVPMKVIFSLPAIRIQPSSIFLGTLCQGTSVKTSLAIDNLSNSTNITIQTGKLLNSQCFLIPQFNSKQSHILDVITKGGNLGQFKSTLVLTVASIYNIKIPVQYEVVPSCPMLLSRSNKLFYTTDFEQKGNSSLDFNATLEMIEKEKNKKKYAVPAFRRLQVKAKSSLSLFQAPQTNSEIRNSTTKIKENFTKVDASEDNCMLPERRMPSAHTKKYPLFVTRRIDKYQPFQDQKQSKKLQKSKNCKEYFVSQIHRQPKNRKQAEEIQRQLTPEQLKLITIGDKIVSFGRIFIKSRSEAEWTIINETQASIQVQLKDNSTDKKKSIMIANSDFEPQIVPSQGAGRFKISFQATACGKYQASLHYIINKIHTFQLLITAEVELVTLTPSKSSIKMSYVEDNDLLLSETFHLKNQGNITAHFSISQTSERFKIIPLEGEVLAGQSQQITVVQNQKHFPVIQAGEIFGGKNSKIISGGSQFEERILIKVADGNDISLKATAQPGLADPRCQVRQQRLNFGCTIVSKEKEKTFQIKNLSRTLSLFQILNDQCSDFLTFDCTKGRIPPEGNKQISATYKSGVIHNISSSFRVLIKGGLIINVPIAAQSIAPEISILETNFSFGEICCDTAAIRQINIKNNSEIAVQLFLDTTGKEKGSEFLMPSFWESTTQPIREGFVPKKIINSFSSYGKGAGIEQEIIDNAIQDQAIHKIKIQSKSIYTFHFVFKPSSPGYFQFLLPIFLEGFIRNQSISKLVSCLVIQPRFIVEPPVLKFKTKIINDKDNGCFHPFVQFLTLRNPTDRVLRWKLDMGPSHKAGTSISSYSSMSIFNSRSTYKESVPQQKSCFQIEQKRGQLKPKESVSINVSFNPIQEGSYYHKVPLFIFNEEKGTYQQESEVRLEGEGKYPSLYFSRRQVILPPVPLGIEAIGMFEVFNDGYESINLKHRFQIIDSQGNAHVSRGNLNGENGLPQLFLFFPQQSKLTLNKRQLIVMVKFVSKKAISFTCKLQIYDDATDCRIYSLPLSATADNSLLTTFAYLSDPQNIYKLENVPLEVDKRKKIEEANTIMLKSNDGRNLIDRYHNYYEQLTTDSFSLSCRIIKRWINSFFREEKLRQFPNDLAENPQLLLKLIQRLTGRKEFDGLYEIQLEDGTRQLLDGHSTNKLTFYQTIIRLLKQFGCLLNHIRPEFLLSRQQFLQAMSKEPGWRTYSSYYIKSQQILHREAWLILIYQLNTQFWCQRQKVEPLSAKPLSNVYSIPQLTVIKWVKSCYENVNELDQAKQKFMSFGKDYKDCIAPIHCLLKYSEPSRKSRTLEDLHKRPITPQQFAANTKLLFQLLQRLNVVPLIYEDEYQYCTDKEIFLFMYQLYELLPQLLPKGPPILFACELGQTITRAIQIKNPSAKTVYYWVKIEGSKDFQIQDKESISIEPKGSYNFNVEFKGRLSVEQVAYLSFFSKQEGELNSANGTAMVFELRTKITGRKSSKVLEPINCPLYDSTAMKILVENIFEENQVANFNITLTEQSLDVPAAPVYRKLTPQNNQELQNTEFKPLFQFQCDTEVVKIKKGSAAAIQLYFTPVRLGRTKCLLIFHDPLVGQFQYQILGITEIPRPLQQLRISQPLLVGKHQSLELNLPVYNSYMLKCETLLEQRTNQKSSRPKEKPEQSFKLQLNMDPKITEHINFPREVMLKGAKKESPENNKIKIDCNFSSVLKDLALDFLLLGDPRREVQDVRRFRVALTIQHPPLTQNIIMTTSARKTLIQSIPLENSTLKDWKVKLAITQNQSSYFSLKEGQKISQKQLIVRKGQSQNFNIYFEPKWMCHCFCKIIVHNITTNEQIILSIKGIGQQPLSQNHIHIRAGTEESTVHTINITNPYPEKLIYRVLCDLQEIQLPPEITLEPNQSMPFNIYAKSAGGSSQVGYLKFVDEEDRFFWYSIGLQSAQKKIREFSVELSAEVGDEIQKFIQFKNPFSKPLHYKVQFPKGVGLQAKQQFIINSHGTYQYRIKFSPERVTEQQVSLKATSYQIGVFLYRIKLKSRDQNKKKAIQLSSEVGKTGQYQIKLDNPRKNSIRINYTLTNHACFSIDGPEILEPGENVTTIKFTPTTEGRQVCSLRIWGDQFPTRCIEVQGTGLAPYTIETIHFRTRPGESSLEVIRFVNPNPKKTLENVIVCLSQASHGFFKVVGREGEGDWVTQVKDLLAVPVEFLPMSKGYFQSVLTIQCFHYQWKYLLKGTTSFRQTERIQEQIKAVNKQQVIKRIKVPVPDYYGQPPSYFDKITIDHQDKSLLKLIKSWLKLKMNSHCEQEPDIITILVKFRPKKQIKEIVRLILSNSKEEGPTLIYNIQLTVAEGPPDSAINLEIESIKTVIFELNGLGQQAGSKIKMLKGNHCQAQRVDNSIKLKFKPTHLLFKQSKVYTDNLLLQNEQQQWNYQIHFSIKN